MKKKAIRRKAIRVQNESSRKMTLSEAIKEVLKRENEDG